ncbi:TrgA family protein [Roseibacterium sp. SDUM158017]|uniref:TrgA family protein n=1 Tax=Roseicyclus salinarum TaxID=3036773 RepID=UPI00241566EB|nr:TrgA family protein [Roseibacterium sp. SDUM158017]MDG4648948.1 TrgA family protein [Roseibacterium sp. SDUM158017]
MLFPPHTQSGSSKMEMPTAAKLFAAILFFGVGWQAATYTLLTFPPEMPAGYFPLTIGLIGAWQGWMVAGGRAGRGIGQAFANGIRTSVQIAFFGILLFSLRTMFMRSANLRYDSPGEATIATLELAIEYFVQSATIPVWTTLIVGGALCGLVVEAIGRIWR